MNSLTTLLPPELTDALGWTLLHSLWQATFIAFVTGILLIALRRASARTRYIIATSGLLTTACLVLLTFAILYEPNISSNALATAEQNIENIAKQDATTNAVAIPTKRNENLLTTLSSRRAFEALKLAPLNLSPQTEVLARVQEYLPLVVVLWAIGMIGFMVRLVGGMVYAQRMKTYRAFPASSVWQARVQHFAELLKCSRVPQLVESGLANAPMVVGFLKPVILVPMGFLTGLQAAHVEAILAHEIAHIRRKDYVLSVIQAAIETLMFYHPAVWWMSSVMREEREHASDDLAASVCGDSRALASALAILEERSFASNNAVFGTASVAATDGHLLTRVKRLLGKQPERSFSLEYLAAYLVITCVFALSLTASPALQPIMKPIVDPVMANIEKTASSLATRLLPPSLPPPPASPNLASDSSRSHSIWSNDEGAIGTEGFWEAKFKEKSLTLILFKQKWGRNKYNGTVYTGLRYNEVQGLNTAMVRSASADVEFRLTKESGTFVFSGEAKTGEGRGTYSFQPNTKFVDQMKTLGFSDVDERDLVMIAVSDVTISLLRELSGLKLSTNDAIEIAVLGIKPDFVREARQLGLGGEEIREYGVLGIKTDYITEMKKSGYGIEEIKELGVLGIKPEYVDEMKKLGIKTEEIKEFGVLGIRPEKVKELKDAGVPTEEIKEYGVLGIRPSYVNEMKTLGYKAEDIKEIGVLGIKPEIVREYKEAGVPVDEIKEFGVLGIKMDYIKQMKALGYKVEDIKEIGVLGIKPETVKAYKEAGVPVDEIKEFGVLGIKVDYIKQMKALGYRVDDIKEIGVLGIKPEMVKAYKEAGVPVDEIKEFGVLGIKMDYIKQMKALGYRVDDIKEIGVLGIKPETVKAYKDAGLRVEDIKEFAILGIKPSSLQRMKAEREGMEDWGGRSSSRRRESADRPERPERPEQMERPERPDRPDRPERVEQNADFAKKMKSMGFSKKDIEELEAQGIRLSAIQKLKADGLSNKRIVEVLTERD